MKIVGSEISPAGTILFIKCDGCGEVIHHPAKKEHIVCTRCGRYKSLNELRKEEAKAPEQQQQPGTEA